MAARRGYAELVKLGRVIAATGVRMRTTAVAVFALALAIAAGAAGTLGDAAVE